MIKEKQLLLEPSEVILDITYILDQNYHLVELFNIMPLRSIIEELLIHSDSSIEDNIYLLLNHLESHLLTLANNSELDYYFNKGNEIKNLFIVISYLVDEVYNHTLDRKSVV